VYQKAYELILKSDKPESVVSIRSKTHNDIDIEHIKMIAIHVSNKNFYCSNPSTFF